MAEFNFEIELFIKKLRKFSCFSNKLSNKTVDRLNNVSFLTKSLMCSARIIDDLPKDDERFVDVYDIDEIDFHLEQNIWCRACDVSKKLSFFCSNNIFLRTFLGKNQFVQRQFRKAREFRASQTAYFA